MRPSCGDEDPPGKHIGALCATDMPSDGPTLSCAGGGTATAVLPARTSDPSAAQSARFLPGTVIAERYRIVAQVGRGGMGEVYRADDLRLGQTVALKFLPESLSRDPAAVGRLNREVRMARQVSHPNVCRVFDVAEADGVQFISMEFVDGEDLGSLLQRIGRLPHDKAVQVAHQLCAGLAAAHAFGVLHRDLKPANIMLDGRGNVRITDFGLAITAEELTGEDEWAGTPAYMAPEQLAGQTATTQSDLYALGLVLYQLFSGKEAYPASTITEMLARRQKGAPVKISSVVKGMDVVIERAIFQCLECDPQSRPRSALVVAAALPGGDPLAAAVAAGETPSPEMVAGAIDEPLVSVGRLWLMAVAIVFGIAVFGMLVQRGTVLGLAPVDKRGEVMAERARQVLDRVGYTGTPADSVYWFVVDQDYVEYRAARGRTPEQAKQWKSATPAPVQFVYRQSPRPLTPMGRRVTQTDPASDIGGMATVILDTAGRLQYLSVVPHQSERRLVSSEPDWTPLLTQAELDPQTPSSTAPRWLPPIGFDQRRAWDGNLGGTPVHVVAASYQGRPVFFQVVAPWTRAEQAEPVRLPHSARIPESGSILLFLLIFVCCLLLARRNVHLGRGDRKGAARIATAMFVSLALYWLFIAHHAGGVAQQYINFRHGIGIALWVAAWLYVAYLALEPYVRRRWPSMLVSWNRVVFGRLADPRVGRDVFTGCLLGVLVAIISQFRFTLATWINIPGHIPPTWLVPVGLGTTLGHITYSVYECLIYPVGGAAALLLFSFLTRRTWMAVSLLILTLTVLQLKGTPAVIDIPAAMLGAMVFVFALMRFGVLGAAACYFVFSLMQYDIPTFDFERWYAAASVLCLACIAGLAVYSFRAALAGRPAFGRAVLED